MQQEQHVFCNSRTKLELLGGVLWHESPLPELRCGHGGNALCALLAVEPGSSSGASQLLSASFGEEFPQLHFCIELVLGHHCAVVLAGRAGARSWSLFFGL
jgi:hypothetical protein